MTPSNQILVKYIGAMFNAIPGGYVNTLEGMFASYGGNLQAMMSGLSGSGAFASVLPPGATDREVAFDLVNRLVGDTAAPADKEWAVGWMAAQKAAGATWGDIMYTAISALDGIHSGAWAATADAMRARADYAVRASDSGWAAGVTDLGTIRDVYSYAIPSVLTTFLGQPPLIPVTKLSSADASLATAAAGLAAHSGSENYTISAADTGKAVLMGAGDDTVTVSYADLLKPTFVSGGDGFDTLVINGGGQDYADFANAYGGVLSTLPFRGFEKIVFTGQTAAVIGAMDGVKQIAFGAGQQGVAADIASVDNGTTIDITANASSNLVRFFEYPPYNAIPGFSVVGAQATTPQLLDSLTFNITAGATGSLIVNSLNAKGVTWHVTGPAGSTFAAVFPTAQPNLEVLKFTSNLNNAGEGIGATPLVLQAPNLKSLDLSGTPGAVEVLLQELQSSPMHTDGVSDGIAIAAPGGIFGFRWAPLGSRVDSYANFSGEYKAGSFISISYADPVKAQGMPASKIVFASDFSELSHYDAQGFGPFVLPRAAGSGSVFNVSGVEQSAAYFKGVAAQGQTIGSMQLGSGQTTLVKVDAGHGIQFAVGAMTTGVTEFVNNDVEHGSLIDTVKDSLLSQLTAGLPSTLPPNAPFQIWHETLVAGGRILWADGNGNGQLDGLTNAATANRPWATTPDFVLMETSDAHIAEFSAAIVGVGFHPLVDLFL
jgi:hypothetical protein